MNVLDAEKLPVTPEGVVVRIGQKWRDLDKRMVNRVCTVVGFDLVGKDPVALMGNPRYPHMKATRVAVRRMKKGSTGWELQPTETA